MSKSKRERDLELLLKRILASEELCSLLDRFDFEVGNEGSAFSIFPKTTQKRLRVIASQSAGGTFFAFKDESASPIFFLSIEGRVCYFAPSLEECLQIILSLPPGVWIEVVENSDSLQSMIMAVDKASRLIEKEISEEENQEEQDTMRKASLLLSKHLAIPLVNNPIEIMHDYFTRTSKYPFTDLRGIRIPSVLEVSS